MKIRILMADDFTPWRHFVSSLILPKVPGWHIVCEVSDGVEAVKKAEELRPDVILLDIGLPKLNGIEVARQITKIAPNSKILFLSAFDSADVVKEALNTGANGYLVKLDAAGELLAAVETVVQGGRFLSSSLKASLSTKAQEVDASAKQIHDEYLGWRLIGSSEEIFRGHEVLFYSEDGVFRESVTHFIGAALKFGNAAIVFATKPHRDLLIEELKAQAFDTDALLQQGTYVSLDAAETLSTFMVNDWPDADRFLETFKSLIESAVQTAKAKHPRAAIFGECSALLWAAGKKEAALQLERLGKDLARTRTVDILCAYPFHLHIQEEKHSFEAIRREHSAVRSK